jgi:hypothetical protein
MHFHRDIEIGSKWRLDTGVICFERYSNAILVIHWFDTNTVLSMAWTAFELSLDVIKKEAEGRAAFVSADFKISESGIQGFA